MNYKRLSEDLIKECSLHLASKQKLTDFVKRYKDITELEGDSDEEAKRTCDNCNSAKFCTIEDSLRVRSDEPCCTNHAFDKEELQ